MELLLVTGAFPVRSQSFIENKAVALARAGHRVIVLAARPGDHDVDPHTARELGDRFCVQYRPHGGAARRLVQSARGAASAVITDPRFTARLVSTLVRRHGLSRRFWRRLDRGLPLAGRRQPVVHFEWASKAAECPEVFEILTAATVVSCRGTDVCIMARDDREFAAELRRVFAAVDSVHCVSEAVLSAAESLGLRREKAFVNHPAVDCEWFDGASDAPEPADPVRILSVGRLHSVKGYEYALQALRLLGDRGLDVSYTIIGGGDGQSESALRFTIEELGLSDRVVLAGTRSPSEVKAALAASHIFVLPSLSEGMSNSTLEALAMARPVVVTDVGGMSELVRDGVDGYLVPSRDAVAMADRLEDLILNADVRAKMGNEGRMRVCESFSLPRQTAAFGEAYQRLVEARR